LGICGSLCGGSGGLSSSGIRSSYGGGSIQCGLSVCGGLRCGSGIGGGLSGGSIGGS